MASPHLQGSHDASDENALVGVATTTLAELGCVQTVDIVEEALELHLPCMEGKG